MFKQVEKTTAVQDMIKAAYGDDSVPMDDLAVFEAQAVSTRPLRRRNGIYQGAQIGVDVLHAMAASIKGKDGSLPVQRMHNPGIPVGRLFAAAVRPIENGHSALHAMFYMARRDSDLVNKIDTGVLTDVSVGMRPKQVLCSACGWDYKGSESTLDNLLDCTCANGHVIGTDGVSARMHGLETWDELSLVDRGASPGASILPRSRHALAKSPAFEQMLLSRGFDDSVFFLRASATLDIEPAPPLSPPPAPARNPINMDELVTLKAEKIVADRDLLAANLQLTAAQTELTALRAKVADVETKLAAALALDAVKVKADAEAAGAFIEEVLKASLAATGGKLESLPATIAERISMVRELRAQLAMRIPAGGATRPPETGTGDGSAAAPSFAAFTRK